MRSHGEHQESWRSRLRPDGLRHCPDGGAGRLSDRRARSGAEISRQGPQRHPEEPGEIRGEGEDEARRPGRLRLQDLAACDIVIEAIIETADLKKQTYAALDKVVKKDAIFASNTSSLTITELSMATARPKQFV